MKGTHAISLGSAPGFLSREESPLLGQQRLNLLAGLDYGGACRPAGEVAQDFFSFCRLPGNELLVAVGDVSGHGMGTELLISAIRAILNLLASRGCCEIARVLEELNRVICEVAPDSIYVTLLCAQVDPQRREVRYVSAGHEPPLLVRKRTGRVQRLDSTGTVLGLTGRTVYEQRTIDMNPGDVLVAFTDGVTEAMNAEGREWSEDGVLSVLRRRNGTRASDLVAEILESAERFADPAAPADDRTAVVVQLSDTAKRTLREEQSMGLALAAA